MALTMSSQFVIWGIGCTLTMLLVLSVQAIDYEVHRHDVTPMKLNGKIILTNRDLLEQLNLVAPKESYTLQEGTERLLYFGALLRMRLLDIFGNLLYIYYDDFSIVEVQALHKVYQEIFERRYDIFNLVPAILWNPDTRPSKICARIYTHAEPCLKSSASVCRRIRPQHDLPHPDDLSTSALNVTHLAYRLSKISRQYLGGFSLAALLKHLQREMLTITPDLLSGLLYNVKYDYFDDDVRLAERELVQFLRKLAHTTEISIPLPTAELKKFRSVNSFLKYYVNIYAEKLSDDNLKRHAFLIAKRIVDDIGTIDENIYLLGNVYENRTIHIKYLFDLVLPDDLLDNDVIDAKKYLVKKLNEFDVVEKHLKVQKYQQATPVQLTMEITGQLKDIDFAKSIAISLRIHARFWRRSHMIESLGELLELFDAYENLRQVPLYEDLMKKIDIIKENLGDMKDIPVEILCNAPRACLQIGLQLVLYCKYVSFEVKELIKEFFQLSNMCVIPVYVTQESRRTVDIPFKISETRFSKIANIGAMWSTERKTTGIKSTSEATIRTSTIDESSSESESSESSEETTESLEISKESSESIEVSTESETEKSTKFMNMTIVTTEHAMPISTTTVIDETSTIQEETSTAATSTTAATTTVLPTTTTLPTTITTLPAVITTLLSTTTLPTTITTILPTVITTTTTSPTITTTLPTTTTAELSTTTTTTSPTTTTTSPTTTTTLPTTTTILPTTTTTTLPITTTTTLPTTTTTSPTTTTTESPTTTTTESPTTTTTESPTTTTTESPTTTTTESPTTTTTSPTTTTIPTTTTALPTTITTTTTTLPTTITSTLLTTDTTTARAVVPVDMKWEMKKKNIFTLDIHKETTESTTASTIPCESNECSSEQSTEKTSEEMTTTTQTSTLESTQTSPESSTIETTVTELSGTPITKEACISKSESTEESGMSCETSCDSEVKDCDKDTSEKVENHTVKCSKVRCKEKSAEISSECETETDKSCDCVSKEEKSAGCVTLCSSELESSSCEERQTDCLKSEMPTINMKLERTRKRGLCEIRDPHHRRQMKRLAKMKAISSVIATSHADILGSKTSKHRNRIASKKLYNLLVAKLADAKDEKSSRIAEYLLKRPFSRPSKIEGASWKRRKQQEKVYRLRRRLARKLSRKLTGRTSMHRSRSTKVHQGREIERISRDAKSINAAADKNVVQNWNLSI
ncbi:uncharacterized protein LOC114936891 [Nylanderia fulva]|uniref:uncharacterized protein LOC114936891 n=1 Tax=Nylanderia fulva TaxID=613905 RepID=UPI0010FB50F1|nr:uncharacterized protein LOC114936891 [Nylanderia fulva]